VAKGETWLDLGHRISIRGFRRLLDGTHPELELSRFLTGSFSHVPQLAGTVEYVGAGEERSTWALMERYLENQGDAWDYTANYLGRFLDTLRATPLPARARHTPYLAWMKTLGLRTAEFHRALAQGETRDGFGSEPLTADDLTGWVQTVRRAMEAMFDMLGYELPQLPPGLQASGSALLSARPALYQRILRLADVRAEGMKTRYHGDFRLGQLWLTNNDLVIANAGGEPALPWGPCCSP
jgi:maltose alpha-D-glucosyltransferase/alpha-amylase